MKIHNSYLNDEYLNLNLKETVNKNFGTKFNVHDTSILFFLAL